MINSIKILHIIQSYHPTKGGTFEVVKQLSERLVKFGHQVTIATKKLPNDDFKKSNLNGIKIIEFDLSGDLVTGFKGELEKYQDFLMNSDFEVITNFAGQHSLGDAILPVLNKIKAKTVFEPTGFFTFFNKRYKNYYKKMANWMKKYDMNVFLSNNYRDIDFARKNKIKKIIVIPNGANEIEFLKENNIDIRTKLNIPKNHFFILHVGSHTGLKGHNEAIKIFTKAKIKNTTLVIIGKRGNYGSCFQSCKNKEKKLNHSKNYEKNGKKLIIKEFINDLKREDIVASYKEANLFLFTSNTECSPIVLFEAMASRTPFLTTDVGNAKEIINWSKSGLLLPTKKGVPLNLCSFDSIKQFIKRIVSGEYNNFSIAKVRKSAKILENIYNSKEERQKMSENGYKVWLQKFTWEKIAKDYENLYENLIKNNK